jgi:hypothetical protein
MSQGDWVRKMGKNLSFWIRIWECDGVAILGERILDFENWFGQHRMCSSYQRIPVGVNEMARWHRRRLSMTFWVSVTRARLCSAGRTGCLLRGQEHCSHLHIYWYAWIFTRNGHDWCFSLYPQTMQYHNPTLAVQQSSNSTFKKSSSPF